MVEQEKYDQVVRAFDTLDKWATKAKKLLEQVRDDPECPASHANAAKFLIWDWKGQP